MGHYPAPPSVIDDATDSSTQAAELRGYNAGTGASSASSYHSDGSHQRGLVLPQELAGAHGTVGRGGHASARAHPLPAAEDVPADSTDRPWLAGIDHEERAKLDEMRSKGLALLATAHPDDPLLCPSRDADRDGVLLRYLRARKTIPGALEQLRRGIAWRRAMKVHEWHQPSLVSPRGILADPCSQVYCCDSGYRDRQGRPYMVGAIDLFDGPTHDPDKHLLAIYYVL